MPKEQPVKRTYSTKEKVSLLVLFLIALAYVGLTFTTEIKPEDNTYNLSISTIRLLQVTIVLPVLAIWTAAWRGSFGVRWYADSITQIKESRAWHFVASGLLAITIAIISSSFISLAESLEYITTEQRVIGSNFVVTWLTMFSFIFIAKGAHSLAQTQNEAKKDKAKQARNAAGMVIVVVLYVLAVFSNESRTLPANGAEEATYYLNDVQILVFAVLPTIIGWASGVVAASNLLRYRKHVKGILYREALKNITYGLLAIVSFGIVMQGLIQLGFLIDLELAPLLAVIYAILILYAIGYMYIYSGAKKLRKIEEV